MKPKILVVDDDHDIGLMLIDRLVFLGFHAVSASNGAEGLTLLEREAVDGILLDIQMPVMDGLTMLDEVRERYPTIPVIVISAEQNKQKLIQAVERGATDFLLKPIDVHLLAAKCRAIFASS
jgi:DNA-binding response OmpR family regulator